MLTNIRSQMNFTFSPRLGNPQFIFILAAITLPIIAGVAATFAGMLVPLTLLGIVYTVIVFINPRIGLYSMIALLPFDSFFLIGDSISLTRLVGILAFSAWMVRKTTLTDVTISLRQKLSIGLLLLNILSFTSLVWAKYQSEVIVDLISQLQLLILYFFVVSQVNSWKKVAQSPFGIFYSSSD